MRSIAGFSIIYFTLFLISQLQAQQLNYGIIKGTVIDSTSRRPIAAATVSVFGVADTTLVNCGITNNKGEFLIAEIPLAKLCRIVVSYSGLSPYSQDFVMTSRIKVLTFNTILLKRSYIELKEVVVSARRPPIVLKKDTLEFDASSFNTAPNSVLEDLLKQLPGMEVDGEGNIMVNGQKVTKITVNGHDFFGDDFKITSKNLPRDIIEKIQVMDSKTRIEQFNKNSKASRDKVINLVLKKDVTKGLFGKGVVAVGTSKQYEFGASLNYFNGPLQLSAIGYINTINHSNFGAVHNGGLNNGITRSKGAGLNFNNEYEKKMSLNGSYVFYNKHNLNATTIRRQNTLPDTSFFYNAAIQNTNNRNEHRSILKIEFKPDSATTITANAEHSYLEASLVSKNEATSNSLEGKLINSSSNLLSSHTKDNKTSLELFLVRRMNKKGRGFSVAMNYNSNNQRVWDLNQGNIAFYKPDGTSTFTTLDQQAKALGSYSRLDLSASFFDRITNRLNLELRYNFIRSNGDEGKYTHRFNPFTSQYDLMDTLFSNTIRTGHRTHFPFISLNYLTTKFNISLGSWGQWIRQENTSIQTKLHLVQNYNGIFPFVNIAYYYSKTGSIHLHYTGSSQQPTIEQLQTVPNNRNTLNVGLGNPYLRAAFFHNMNLSWRQSGKKTFWSANLEFGTANNQIVYETWFDSVQFSRPVNTNGNYNFIGTYNFTKTWKKKDWSWRLSFSGNAHYNRTISYANKIMNTSRVYGLTQTLGLSVNYNQLITLNPSFSLRYNNIHYSFQTEKLAANITKVILLSTMINWPQRFIMENNIQYNHNSRTAPGFPEGVAIWNMALNYHFLKQKQAILRFSIFDLLKQSTSINRIITPNYTEDTRTQVLQQYFLLSIIYNLKRFGN